MMIVHVDDIRMVFPGGEPVHDGNLECGESLRIVRISIYFFTIQQSIDVEEVEVETEFVCLFLDDRISEPPVAQVGMGPLWTTSN